MEAVDVVVQAAAYLGDDRDLARAVNVEGTRGLAAIAAKAGVTRFVHISTMSVHGEPQPDGLTEDSPLAATDTTHAYVATKAQAELVLKQAGANLEIAILRPGAICRPVNSQWGDQLVARLRDHGWPAGRHPDDVIPWVHTDDLADMTWLCATEPAAAGETFVAVDRNISLRDYLVPLMNVLDRRFTPPERDPIVSRCHIGKIHDILGYRLQRTFEDTLDELLTLSPRFQPVPDAATPVPPTLWARQLGARPQGHPEGCQSTDAGRELG